MSAEPRHGFSYQATEWGAGKSVAESGFAYCLCGAKSPRLGSNVQRFAWVAQHERDAAAAAPRNPGEPE